MSRRCLHVIQRVHLSENIGITYRRPFRYLHVHINILSASNVVVYLWFIADINPECIVHWLLVSLAINKTSKPTGIRFKPHEICHFMTFLNTVLKKKLTIEKKKRNRYLSQQSIIFNLNTFSTLCSLSIIIHYANKLSKTTVISTLSDLKYVSYQCVHISQLHLFFHFTSIELW